ncbi:DUF4406 domain-containing protein [Hornefia butyriciproducens]|uniref:DUF4406 domain-containing protein n=1 Tax=Hornefia butyriciproducens TaxID=2652293 RepID=UPI003F89142C
MNMKRRIKTTYISGPVSGLDREEAERRFRAAEKMIKERGEMPINPLGLCTDDMTYAECLREDIMTMLQSADKIYMLKGFEESPGADLELDVAEMCGLEVEYEED